MKKTIEALYDFKIIDLQEFGNGKSSKTYKVSTENKNYVLKSFTKKEEVLNEFYCLEALSELTISPTSVRTIHNEMYVKIKRVYFICMNFINSNKNQDSIIDFFTLGQMIKNMHVRLSKLELNRVPDRFNESESAHRLTSKKLQAIINKKYNEYTYLSNNHSNIHGDLGSWNILETKNQMYIIDFGEVRYDSPFFDLAAITESFQLNNEEIKNLLNGYGAATKDGITQLDAMREKWKLRGLIYLAVNKLKSEQDVYNLLK